MLRHLLAFEVPEGQTPGGRVGGLPKGLPTTQWPRFRGVPMQLLATIDVAGLDLGLESNAEALMVFVDSYYETDLYEPAACAVRLVDGEALAAHPVTEPPEDFVAEAIPDTISTELVLQQTPDDDEPNEADSFIGGDPVWPEETGAPDSPPSGAFVAQLSWSHVSFTRAEATLYVFEGGAVVVPHLDDDENPKPWAEALAESRELIIEEAAPEADALIKFGGVPKHCPWWPTGDDDQPLTHLMTLPPDALGELGEDAIAVAIFVDLTKARGDDWDDADFFELMAIESDDEPGDEPPEGTEQLPPRALVLASLQPDTHWRQLRGRSFVGPRRVYYDPDDADSSMVIQLESSVLPGVTRAGAFYLGDLMMSFQSAPETDAG